MSSGPSAPPAGYRSRSRFGSLARSSLIAAAPGLLLACAVLLPFRNKAFTIDDTLFLQQARHLLVDPLHATAFETVWSEARVPLRVSAIMPSGPVMAWLLVPSVSAGGAEWLAHLAVLGTLALGVWATVA